MENLIQQLAQCKESILRLDMRFLVRVKRRSYENEYTAFDVPICNNIVGDIVNLLIDGTIDKLYNKSLVNFNPTSTEHGTIEYLPTVSINNYANIYQILSSPITENIEELNFEDIWGYSIKLTYTDTIMNCEKDMTFYKKFSYPKVLNKSKSYVLSFINGSYNKLENDIITIDSDIHSFTSNETMYVLNKGQFERFFNFSSAYEEIVNNSITELEQLNVIDNFQDFADKCLNSDTLTRRLVKIISENKFATIQRCIERVPNVIADFQLNVRFENDRIVFDDSCSVSDMITLIRGACVIGALDNEKYLASETKNL